MNLPQYFSNWRRQHHQAYWVYERITDVSVKCLILDHSKHCPNNQFDCYSEKIRKELMHVGAYFINFNQSASFVQHNFPLKIFDQNIVQE